MIHCIIVCSYFLFSLMHIGDEGNGSVATGRPSCGTGATGLTGPAVVVSGPAFFAPFVLIGPRIVYGKRLYGNVNFKNAYVSWYILQFQRSLVAS